MTELNNVLLITPLQTLILERQGLDDEAKTIKKKLDKVNAEIKDAMIDAGIENAEAGDWEAVLSVRDKSTLDKAALIHEGVSTDQIFKATKVSTYIQLDVRKKKVGE